MKLTGLKLPNAKQGENKPAERTVQVQAPLANSAAKPFAIRTTPVTCDAPIKADTQQEVKDSRTILPNEDKPDTYVTAIHKETLKPTDIRLPDAEVQPRMAAIKKPSCGETTTSSHVLKKNPFAKSSLSSSLQSTGELNQKKNPFSSLGKSKLAEPQQNNVPNPVENKPVQVTSPSQTSTGGKVNLFGKKQVTANDLFSKPTPPKDPTLWGTGLTKNLLGKAAKELEKAEAAPQSAIQTVTSTSVVDDHILPDTLMDNSLVLDEYQAPAVEGLSKQMYGVLIGAAGTGKTTALKAIVADLEDSVIKLSQKDLSTYKDSHEKLDFMVPAIAFCSFTGKAVQQMKRALPKKYHALANTIHATLGYAPVEEDYLDKETNEWRTRKVFRPSYTATNKLPYQVVIIDEAGTVPVALWHELLAALPEGCRIIMLGDLNQLPPVTGHSILGFAMLKWPTYVLEKLHRQAAGDPIAENAHRILAGKKPLTDQKSMRFVVKPIEDGSVSARKQILGTIQHLHTQGIFDPMLDALIVPQNIGNIGQVELNTCLVNYFNPPRKDEEGRILNKRHIITAGYAHVMFAVGDKVMLTANDTQRGLTNGMVGVVTHISNNNDFAGERVAVQAEADLTQIDLSDLDFAKTLGDDEEDTPESERAASHIMTVKLQNVDSPVEFATAGGYKNIMLAYAMTCHKSQGSEYRNVIAVAHASNLKMLNREWLYTAITRAKQRVILLTNNRGLTHAVNNQRIKGDTIAAKAKKFLEMQGKTKAGEVRLPEPSPIKSLTMTRG